MNATSAAGNYVSTTNASKEGFNTNRFIVLETSVSIFTVITIYLTAAFIIYECRRPGRRWAVSTVRSRIGQERSYRYAIIMRTQSITAAVFLLGRYICEHYELVAQYTGAYSYDYCDGILKAKVALTAVSILGVYSFLWTRQRFCYSDPAMKHLTSRTTKALSWISLVLLVLAQVVGTILFTTTRFYKMTPHGCYNYKSTIPAYIPWIWLAGATVCFQLLLLSLFVYPLVKQRSLVETNVRGLSRSFLPLIRRATATAAICIVTDIISSLLILLAKDNDDIIPTLAYDITILINIICIIGAFRDWKPRLLSPCLCCNKAQLRSGDISANDNLSRKSTCKSNTPQRESRNRDYAVWSVSGTPTPPETNENNNKNFENKAMKYDEHSV